MSSVNNSLKKLKYKIISCSSEQSQYPVSSLLFGSGCWQTKRFCTYPQEITFQFYGAVSISKIELISDNRKIPCQVDILYYSPSTLSTQRFIKYGFLNFNKNQNSQLKQQKSLMVDIKCLYLRFLFHKPFNSKENFFSQIGIHGIQIYGNDGGMMAVVEKGARQVGNAGYHNNINSNSLNSNNNYEEDLYITEKLAYLAQLKQKAVSEQDFEQANFLKTMTQQVRQLGEQLKKLQMQKHEAIQLEDYQKANHLKKSIDKHKKQIDALIQFQDDDQVIQNQGAGNQNNNNGNYDSNNNHQNDFQDNQFVDPEMNQIIRNSSTFNKNNNNPNQNKSNLSNNNNTSNSRVISNSRVKLNRSLLKNSKPFPQNYDQRVIPTLNNNNRQKTQIPQQSPGQQQQQPRPQLHPQQLDGKFIQFSLILQQHFQQQLIKCFFSSYWQLKVQALNLVLQEIKKKQLDQQNKIDSSFIKSLIVVVKNSVSEMNFQVALNSLLVLGELLRLNKKGNYLNRGNQLNNDLDGIGKEIVKRLSDNNNKIKQQAQKRFIQMISSSLYGPQISSLLLTKTKQKSTKLSSKQIIIRLIQLQKIAQSHSSINQIIQYSLDYGIEHCKNPSLEVRNQAISLLICCKSKNQQEVEKKLKQQKNVLEMIQTMENKSKGENGKAKRKK